MNNKMTVIILMILTAIALALFAYSGTVEGDDGQVQTFTFPTATPTTDLIGTGWWNTLPTPIAVETLKP